MNKFIHAVFQNWDSIDIALAVNSMEVFHDLRIPQEFLVVSKLF